MKLKTTIVFFTVVLVFALAAFLLVPRLFPRSGGVPAGEISEASESSVVSGRMPVTLSQMIDMCDAVVRAKVIKADVSGDSVSYTLQITKVYKGRNYTTLGYAEVLGKQSLTIAQEYVFLGVTGTEKYHYQQPGEDLPWIFAVGQDGEALQPASNGDTTLLTDCAAVTLTQITTLCKGLAE